MEIQAVADIRPEYITEVKRIVQGYSLRQNFTFMPKYHVEDLLEEHGHDLAEFTKQLFMTNWGPWSPRPAGASFIQVFNIYEPDSEHIQIVLTRDRHEHKSVYVIKESTPRYGHYKIEACTSLYMCDLDDNGQFSSKALDNTLLINMQKYDGNQWHSMY